MTVREPQTVKLRTSDTTLFLSMSRGTLIVAATMNNRIGQAGKLPRHLPQEILYFARVAAGRGGAAGQMVKVGVHPELDFWLLY